MPRWSMSSVVSGGKCHFRHRTTNVGGAHLIVKVLHTGMRFVVRAIYKAGLLFLVGVKATRDVHCRKRVPKRVAEENAVADHEFLFISDIENDRDWEHLSILKAHG